MLIFQPIPGPDPREGKLPLWAQKQLKEMRRMCGDYQHAAAEARAETKPNETNTFLDFYAAIPIGLPNNANVTFKLNNHLSVGVRAEGDQLHVLGSEFYAILPQSSNAIRIRPAR